MAEDAKKIAKSMHFEECEDCAFNPTRLGCRWRREGIYCDTNLHRYADLIESLTAELEQVKRERDAAVEQLRGVCRACIYYKDNEMPFCCYFEDCANGTDDWDSEDYWQWRGVKEENDER